MNGLGKEVAAVLTKVRGILQTVSDEIAHAA